jgi:hypothetical protein
MTSEPIFWLGMSARVSGAANAGAAASADAAARPRLQSRSVTIGLAAFAGNE